MDTQIELKHPIYAGASEGPFRCSNCEYANADATKCFNAEIIKLRWGKIEPGGCCDYFEKGKKSLKFTHADFRHLRKV